MRQLLAFLTVMLLTLSGPLRAQEQSAEQQQAQKYFDEFRGMVMIYYVDVKCDVLDPIAFQATLATQADRLDTLIAIGGATGDQLNEVMANIETQIQADTCENLAALESIAASKNLAEFYRDFYLLLWDRYLLAASRHQASGGDLSDYDCGKHTFADIEAIGELTNDAEARLKTRGDYAKMDTTATSQAQDLLETCAFPADQIDALPLVELLVMAQAVVEASAAEAAE